MSVVVDDLLLTSALSPDDCLGSPWGLPPDLAVPPLYCGVPNDIAAQIELQAVPEPFLMGPLALGVGMSIKRARSKRGKNPQTRTGAPLT